MYLDTRRPFSRADAIAAGIEPKLLRGSKYRRIFRGVYIDATVEMTPVLRVEAATVPFPKTAFASHFSAARLFRVPVPTWPTEHITVSTEADRRTRAGIRCHISRNRSDVMVAGGVRVSSYARMFVELGEFLSLVDLVVVGDHLVEQRWLTREELRDCCARPQLPGAAAARTAASYVRARVESPMETRVRLLLVLAGLPEPVVNETVRTAKGKRRFDLSYRRSKLVIEYDGRHHIEREKQWQADLMRREEIENEGWQVIVLTSTDVYNTPGDTVLRVWSALRARREPGVPARLSDDWRPHFPGRVDAA